MTLRDALLESKESGRSYMRPNGAFGGWVRWCENWEYRHLQAEDLVADNWETSEEVIPKITGGKWRLADGEK